MSAHSPSRWNVARLAPILAVLLATSARADDIPATRGAVAPPIGVVVDDVAFSVDANPAAIAFVPRYAAVVAHGRAGDSTLDHRGTAAYVAAAHSRIGVGVGYDRRVTPAFVRGRLSLALAYAPSPSIAFGVAYRHLGGDDATIRGSTVDLGVTYRPSRFLSLGAVANDVLVPLSVGRLSDNGVHASLGVFLGFRPLGNPIFSTELGFTADTVGHLHARLFGALSFARAGRVYFVGNLDDRSGSVTASMLAGLELRLDGIHAGSGVLADERGDAGFLGYVGIDGRATFGVVERDRLVEIRMDGEVTPMELVDHLLAFDRARFDSHVAGVVLRVRNTHLGMAGAQEIRQAITLLTSTDRLVTCLMESPTGAEVYACSAATESFVDEAGTVRLVGPSVDLAAYGALLDRLGLHADFVRIGAYKSAPERFMLAAPSEESVAQTAMYLDDASDRLVQDLAVDLDVPRTVIRAAIDGGPHGAEGAEAIGLVDGSLDASDLEEELQRLHHRSLPLAAASRGRVDGTWGVRPHVAVVVLDGPLVDGRSASIPILGMRTIGADTVVATLRRLEHDDDVRAVVLRIDSPGGSTVASDRMWRAVHSLAEEKPVVVSMGSIAASGGYYVASAASTIFADPTTLTGSIGVYYGKIDVAPLATRLGIGVASIERGEHAGATSMWRPFDEGERARLTELVSESYALFLRRIAEGRNIEVAALDGLAEGRIWSGDRAHHLGLVDHLGGLLPAIAHARTLADLEEDAPVVVAGRRSTGIVERIASSLVAVDAPTMEALTPLAWLAFAEGEGMWALAPMDDGAR